MKKNLLKIASILFVGAIAISASAQGTWKTTETIPSVAVSTETGFGITGLTCMHSDAAGVVGKPDAATSVTYNGVTYDNAGIFQGATNGMYFAFRPTGAGQLDVAVKMGSAKKTFVLEVSSVVPENADLALLTTNYPTGDAIFVDPSYYALPQVFDTYNNTTGTWDGSAAIQSTGANVYMVMSFPVAANKTYVVGVIGSKLMLRGVNYTVTPTGLEKESTQAIGISPNPAKGSVVVNVKEATEVSIVNSVGATVKQQAVSASDNTIDISGLASGIYFVKDINSSITQKLIVK